MYADMDWWESTRRRALFEVVGRAYERTSLIVITNLPFESWTEVMGSEHLTGALSASRARFLLRASFCFMIRRMVATGSQPLGGLIASDRRGVSGGQPLRASELDGEMRIDAHSKIAGHPAMAVKNPVEGMKKLEVGECQSMSGATLCCWTR